MKVSAENSMVCAKPAQRSSKCVNSLGNIHRRSPRLFLEMSPSASTSKGFFIVRTRVTDRRACSNGIARWSNSQGEVTELLCLFGETWFKSRRLFWRWQTVLLKQNCCVNSCDRIVPHFVDTCIIRSLSSHCPACTIHVILQGIDKFEGGVGGRECFTTTG